MSDESLKPIWEKLDRAHERINQVETTVATQGEMLRQHNEDFRRLNKSMSEQHAELLRSMGELSGKVDNAMDVQAKRTGALEMGKWIVATGLVIGLLIVGAMSL